MRYELINLQRHSIVIEDLGIRFDGVGSRVVLDENQFMMSQNLKSILNFFKVNRLPEEKASWPFIPEAPPPKSPIDISNVNEVALTKILSKMDEMIKSINNLQLKVNTTQYVPAPSQHTAFNESSINEPVFIPSKIIPDQVETSLQVRESDTEKHDMEEASNALRNLRRK